MCKEKKKKEQVNYIVYDIYNNFVIAQLYFCGRAKETQSYIYTCKYICI